MFPRGWRWAQNRI